MPDRTILVNRAPVLTLWAAVVAERLGHDRAAALTLGKAVAGLNAQSKGRRLGLFEAPGPGARPRKAEPRAARRTRPPSSATWSRSSVTPWRRSPRR